MQNDLKDFYLGLASAMADEIATYRLKVHLDPSYEVLSHEQVDSWVDILKQLRASAGLPEVDIEQENKRA